MRVAAATLALALLVACGGDAAAPEGRREPAYRLDDTLRLNQIQVLGTHNSYHVAPRRARR